ncbi:PREDICTED: hepatitis A virus cellular receptor 1-like [Miniopterus natalensis]|uniref:hepatitis A virus cellular receptor 1-like n=1 Tax=Miniopterus natalensis TaxID=291302 RepID=UPI0007A71B64|nr:PREDICTED: hepatitis A virus cellular receptor 1-like [Miniopterus natalensis]
MLPWAAFPSLVLLWADAVVSQARVSGVVGQPVTLPCTYSTAREVTTMCWGRGGCSVFKCSNEIIWTDGYRVTFRKDKRYELKGLISKGNVSLTIENAAQSDSGVYCCRVEHSGWFNDLKISISVEIKPAPPKVTSVPASPRASASAPTTPAPAPDLKTALPEVTSAPTSPRGFTSAPTMPAPTPDLKTAPLNVTSVPASPRASTSAPTMPASTQKFKTETPSSSPVRTAETQPITAQGTNATSSSLDSSCPTGGSSTVTQPSDGGWQFNETHTCLKQTWRSASKDFCIGLAITAMILLTIMAAKITKKYLCVKRKVLQISKEPETETSRDSTAVRYEACDNIYFENNLYNVR